MNDIIHNLIVGKSYQYDDKDNIIREITVITNKQMPIDNQLVIDARYDHKGRLIEIKSSNGQYFSIKYNLFGTKVINKQY